MKSPKPRNKAQRKVDYKNYDAITMRRNYQEKLWHEIIRRNYDAKLWASILCRAKCGNYRDTGVSKNKGLRFFSFILCSTFVHELILIKISMIANIKKSLKVKWGHLKMIAIMLSGKQIALKNKKNNIIDKMIEQITAI